MTLGEHVAYWRKAHGWSQEDLARQLGVSRQTVIALEHDQRMPHLALAVKLADVLHLTLDELTRPLKTMSSPSPSVVWLTGVAPAVPTPVVLSRVQQQTVAVPWTNLATGAAVDAWYDPATDRLVPLPDARPPDRVILVAGCDPFLPWLKTVYERAWPGYWLETLRFSSVEAIHALARRVVHVAGSHLFDPDTKAYNRVDRLLPFAVRLLPYLEWEEGLIRHPEAEQPGFWAIRERGSEAHALFYRHRPPTGPQAQRVLWSHQAVVDEVRHNPQALGVGLGSLARMHGLSFTPWAKETYEWCLAAEDLTKPWARRLLAILHPEELNPWFSRLDHVALSPRLGSLR